MTDITLEKLLEAQTVETADSQLVVQMPDQKLQVGRHNFRLTVQDDSGNQSVPATITVIVIDSSAPTAVVDLLDEQGRTVTNGRINFGSGFQLSGKRSTDIGGAITRYVWEMVPN
jgi:hypothetical protein